MRRPPRLATRPASGYDMSMSANEQPATEQGVAELEAGIDQRFTEFEARIAERARDMQTEILRSLEAFAREYFARMDSLEAHLAVIEQSLVSTNDRIASLEKRVLSLEVYHPRP